MLFRERHCSIFFLLVLLLLFHPFNRTTFNVDLEKYCVLQPSVVHRVVRTTQKKIVRMNGKVDGE